MQLILVQGVKRAERPWSPKSHELPLLPLVFYAILDEKSLDLSEPQFPYL